MTIITSILLYPPTQMVSTYVPTEPYVLIVTNNTFVFNLFNKLFDIGTLTPK